MVSHDRSPARPAAAVRTGSSWRRWRDAWLEAAYAPDGFWSREQPGSHFATAVGVGPALARAVAGLVPEGVATVVDVGAGDGALLTHLLRLLPGVALVGVDRRARPAGLHPRVGWVVDHWDVRQEAWSGGGPDAWCGSPGTPMLVAHEWLDDLPVPVVVRDGEVWHELEVDPSGRERLGPPVAPEDGRWLERWWGEAQPGEGARAEVGRSRDAAWAHLVRTAAARGGRALAVDYGHRAGDRPPSGTLLAYARGRQRVPVPDGSVNLTAGVAVDALADAGVAVGLGVTTLLLDRQAQVLARVPVPLESDDPLAALANRSERSALTSPRRWGGLWWLLQGPGPSS